MKELFYFSKSDLMIQVQYSHKAHTLRYSSHRKITDGERNLIEKYITSNITTVDKNPKYIDANLDYAGVDFKLIHHLHQFHSVKPFEDSEEQQSPQEENPFKRLLKKDIETSVNDLINTSMENYYFEKIGGTIMETRKKIMAGTQEEELQDLRQNLEQLLNAYNQYSATKVKFKDILPEELIS